MKVQTVLLLAGAAAVQGIQPRIVLPPVEILRPHVNASQLQGVKIETVQGRKNADDKHHKFPPAADEAAKKSSTVQATATAQVFDNEGIIPFQGLPFPSVGPIVVKDQEVPDIPEIPEIPGQEPVPTPPKGVTSVHTPVHTTISGRVSAHSSKHVPHHYKSYTSEHTHHTHKSHKSHPTLESKTPHAPRPSFTHSSQSHFHEPLTPSFVPRSPPKTTSVTPTEEPRPEDREEDVRELEEDNKVTTKHPKTPKPTTTAKHIKTKYPKGSKPVKKYPLDPSEPREPNEGDRDVHEEQQGQKDIKAKKLQQHEEHKSSRLAHQHEAETTKTHTHKSHTHQTTETSVPEITESSMHLDARGVQVETTKTHTHKTHTHHTTETSVPEITESSMHLDARGVQVSCTTTSSTTSPCHTTTTTTSPCHTTTSTTPPCHTSTLTTSTIVVVPSGIIPSRNTTCEDEGEGQAAHVPISGAVENTAAPVMALIAAAAAGMLLF
ncbi:hypothetical protein E4U57_007482 [Claviceps arundinis]|uniref:Uncharacterized protein n=1 Tax=Claviceps arundinis TaxID=1623583 RepID=A0ABQ7PGW3_9HYPO|nr:hypothetical protein E4U57_007482 [Claviceps arundinis]